MYDELVKRLRNAAQWADKGLVITPSICLEAADTIENTSKAYQMMAEAYEAEVTKSHWIKFVLRPLTEEEQREHPDWCYILDCRTPDDGQEILVSDGRYVWTGTFCQDGDQCYLDGDAELESCWWQPMPQPPKEVE